MAQQVASTSGNRAIHSLEASSYLGTILTCFYIVASSYLGTILTCFYIVASSYLGTILTLTVRELKLFYLLKTLHLRSPLVRQVAKCAPGPAGQSAASRVAGASRNAS